MKKVAFVIPWFGESIPGGAESLCRDTAVRLKKEKVNVEIITTCIKEFNSDWDTNFWEERCYEELNLPIRRFSIEKTNRKEFDAVNYKLMNNIEITKEEEEIYINNLFRSNNLINYLREHDQEYLYFFIPYMFPSTYYGIINSTHSYLIPCLHDESYAYMNIFKLMFKHAKAILYLSPAEMKIAEKIYKIEKSKCIIIGAGVNTNIHTIQNKNDSQYILYAGRKDKNLDQLITYFLQYVQANKNDLRLLLIGPGKINPLPERVIDKGYVSIEEKYNLMANSLFLCQPSTKESFSIVMMESWVCQRPVLVHEDCLVTKEHCIESNGGLWFKDYFSFEACCNYFLNNPPQANLLGLNGKAYVKKNYDWNVVIKKYLELIANAD